MAIESAASPSRGAAGRIPRSSSSSTPSARHGRSTRGSRSASSLQQAILDRIERSTPPIRGFEPTRASPRSPPPRMAAASSSRRTRRRSPISMTGVMRARTVPSTLSSDTIWSFSAMTEDTRSSTTRSRSRGIPKSGGAGERIFGGRVPRPTPVGRARSKHGDSHYLLERAAISAQTRSQAVRHMRQVAPSRVGRFLQLIRGKARDPASTQQALL
jgi:hypothetical protein